MSTEKHGYENRLINERSPYLQQHAHNPVDWYPWGEEAKEKARREDKPMLISIGYSTCHWCHVMERESYEDVETARVMNENFVNIKVDREERPDIDSLYMKAVQALTGHAGWPLNVFTTPEGVPFYGGTYFPPEDKLGLPAFRKVLSVVSDIYGRKKDNVDVVVSDVETALNRMASTQELEIGSGVAEKALEAARLFYDPVNGGFGISTKFPHAMFLKFLLKHWKRTGEKSALSILEGSLRGMALGGIYDHIGGGFHRYSVDEMWEVPHFEKMLYDNALLLDLYSNAFRETGVPLFGDVARETAGYLRREMASPDGGFYSAQDADSEGREGAYYIWTPKEIEKVLGDKAGRFMEYFSVTAEGNYEGKNTLRVARPLKEGLAEIDDDIKAIKKTLLEVRSKRVPPDTDRKVITAWNGLAASALVAASTAFDEPAYLKEAERCVDFILGNSTDVDGRLLRYWIDGSVNIKANLEDYALLGGALLSIYESTGDKTRLASAVDFADSIQELFGAETEKTFYDTGIDQEKLFFRERDLHDTDLPSGNSAAAAFLLKLGRATGEGHYTDRALGVLSSVSGMVEEPLSYGHLLCVLEDHLASEREPAGG